MHNKCLACWKIVNLLPAVISSKITAKTSPWCLYNVIIFTWVSSLCSIGTTNITLNSLIQCQLFTLFEKTWSDWSIRLTSQTNICVQFCLSSLCLVPLWKTPCMYYFFSMIVYPSIVFFKYIVLIAQIQHTNLLRYCMSRQMWPGKNWHFPTPPGHLKGTGDNEQHLTYICLF